MLNRVWREHWQWLMLCMVIAAMLLRKPILLLEPRFWAEEGSVFFSHAMLAPWYEVLLSPHQGYFSLFNNIVAVMAAHWVPLTHAPFVTTYAALLVQCLPYVIILFGCSSYWPDKKTKILACFIVLFIAQDSEIWLNSINSQFHLSLVAFLLLCENLQHVSKRRFYGYALILGVAGLTGVIATMLTPLFLYQAWRSRHRRDMVMALIMLFSVILQLYFIASYQAPADAPIRFEQGLAPGMIATGLFSYTFFAAIFDSVNADTLMHLIESKYWQPEILGLIVLGVIACLSLAIWLPVTMRLNFIFAIAVIGTLSIIAAVGGDPRPRYAYSTAVIFMLMLLMLARDNRSWLSLPAMALILIGLGFNVYQFFFLYPNYDPDWPKWERQVELYQQGEIERLRVHPMEPYFSVRMPALQAGIEDGED